MLNQTAHGFDTCPICRGPLADGKRKDCGLSECPHRVRRVACVDMPLEDWNPAFVPRCNAAAEHAEALAISEWRRQHALLKADLDAARAALNNVVMQCEMYKRQTSDGRFKVLQDFADAGLAALNPDGEGHG